jgi:rare lipoprotein A
MNCRWFPPAGGRLVLLAPLALAACSTLDLPDAPKSVATPRPHYKIGAPYQVDGKWYAPKVDRDYDETGIASWYGDGFDGRLTANGELFDRRRLSAAHKTLPLPTLVEVENLENGRRVLVRVNDRGPFVGDRLIDLSHAAADELGFSAKGLARVRVRYVGEAEVAALAALPGAPAVGPAGAPPDDAADPIGALIAAAAGVPASPAAPPAFWVELAQLEDVAALEAMTLKAPDFGPVSVQSEEQGGARRQSLRLGPFLDEAIALASLSRAQAAGFSGARIIKGF